MYLKLKIAYNSCSETLKNLLEELGLEFEAYNEETYSEKKKAYALKNPYAARETPFVEFLYKDKIEKVFYTENSECTYDFILKYINNWVLDHAKKGYIEIEEIEGSKVGRYHKGMTQTFMEGISLRMSNISTWFRTSVVKDIDWENKIFHTLNSTYKFKFNESKSNQQESE